MVLGIFRGQSRSPSQLSNWNIKNNLYVVGTASTHTKDMCVNKYCYHKKIISKKSL